MHTRTHTHTHTHPLLQQNCHSISPLHSHSHSSKVGPHYINWLISLASSVSDLHKFTKILPVFPWESWVSYPRVPWAQWPLRWGHWETLSSVQPQHPALPSINLYSHSQRGTTGGDLRLPHCSVSLYSSPEFISPCCHFFQLYLWPGEVHSDKKSQAMHTLRSLSHPK